MILHSSLGPNPRLVRMFLAEKGLVEGRDFQRKHYDIITGENRQDKSYAAKNPLGTMPTLELDDGTCLTESWPICELIEELFPDPNLIGVTAEERAEVRKWCRLIDQEIVVPMTVGFRATGGRPMFEPRLRVLSEAAGAEMMDYANAQWLWLDSALGGKPHIAAGRMTLACLMVYCFANFGFTVGWQLPDGADNIARFLEANKDRPSAEIWTQSE
ncbi:MAG: glutathione S-transferase family protein [Pseudomonadota bacterium]